MKLLELQLVDLELLELKLLKVEQFVLLEMSCWS